MTGQEKSPRNRCAHRRVRAPGDAACSRAMRAARPAADRGLGRTPFTCSMGSRAGRRGSRSRARPSLVADRTRTGPRSFARHAEHERPAASTRNLRPANSTRFRRRGSDHQRPCDTRSGSHRGRAATSGMPTHATATARRSAPARLSLKRAADRCSAYQPRTIPYQLAVDEGRRDPRTERHAFERRPAAAGRTFSRVTGSGRCRRPAPVGEEAFAQIAGRSRRTVAPARAANF